MMVPDPSFIVMRSPGVPVPVMVGVESAVANGQLVSPPIEVGVDGADGGMVSTIRLVPVFEQFAGVTVSQEVMVRGVVPSPGAGERGPQEYAHDPFAVPVQRVVPDPSVMVMSDHGSAVPVRVRAPVLAGDGRGEIVGIAGGVVSSMKSAVPVAVLPAVSVREIIGSDPMIHPVPVQVTIPVDEVGVGVQVVPGMVRVDPLSILEKVKVTSDPELAGLGVMVGIERVGGVASKFPTVNMTAVVDDVFPERSTRSTR
jgi:hypothetical protein